MNKKLKRKQALIMSEPYRTPFNSEVAKVNGDVIEDSVGEIKYATSFNGATKIEDANANKIRIEDGTYYIGKSVNLLDLPDKEKTTTNGITYSIKDGVITLNGTNSTTSTVWIWIDFVSTLNGSYSFNSFAPTTTYVSGTRISLYDNTTERSVAQLFDNEYSSTIELANYECKKIGIACGAGQTLTNATIKPILVSGSTIPTKYYSGAYGIKIEVADGVITFNGIMQTNETLYIDLENKIYSGTYSFNSFASNETRCDMYLLSPQTQIYNSNNLNLQSTNGFNQISFFMIANTDYDNLILKPMLVLGSTAPTSFEPNFKNLLEIGDLSERTKDGLTYYYKNGMIVVNGTSNGGYTHIYDNSLGAENFEDGATYSFNDISNDNNLYLQFSLAKKDGTTQYLTKKNSFVWDSNIYSICYIAVQTAPTITTFNNIVIKPTFVKSSVIPTQFIPFVNPYFVSLGQNGRVQYNGLEPREIDLKGNVISKINNQASDKLSNYALTKNIKVVDLGSFNWSDGNTQTSGIIRWASNQLASDIVYPNATSIAPNLLCTRYDTITADQTFTNVKGITLDQFGNLVIYDPDYNTSDKLEEFKKSLRGILLMYQTKNPTTINTTSFKTFKEDTNATISDTNFTSSTNVITETFKPTRSYDFKVNGFSNLIKSSNLFFLPNIKSTTLLGLTYNASNQKMTVSGTSTQQYIVFYSKDMTDKMVVGKTYVLQCSSNSLSLILQASIKKTDGTYEYFVSYDNPKFTWASDYESVQILVQDSSPSGTTINLSNITFGLYETDNVSIPYEPYFDPYIESFADKKNLLTPPYIESSTKNGVSVINNNDGSFTFNGRATATSTFVIWGNHQLPRGTYYFSSNVSDNKVYIYNETANVYIWNSGYFVANGTDRYRVVFIISEGVTVSNYITKPMLIQGKTPPTTFLPYKDKYSAFLNVKGRNLLYLSQMSDIAFSTKDNQTITYSKERNGVYLIKDYPLENGTYEVSLILKTKLTTPKTFNYIVSGTTENSLFTNFENFKLNEIKTKQIEITENKLSIILWIDGYQEFDFQMMVVKGKTAPTAYEPYYSYTKEVLLNQPLRKFDYLTYEGVYRQTNEIVLDGTNNLFMSDNGTIQVLNIPNVDSLNTDYAINYASQLMVTTSDLPLVPCRDIQVDAKKGIGTNNGVIYIKLDDSTDNSLNNWTVEKVNNYFKQNPITITYKTVDQTFEATSLTRLLLKNGYNKITPYDSINNNAIVEYLEYYKSKGD